MKMIKMGQNVESVWNQLYFSLTTSLRQKEYALYTQLNIDNYGWPLILFIIMFY